MNRKFQQYIASIPGLFERLQASDSFTAKGVVAQKGKQGVYVFFEAGAPVYVGRTQNLQGRLRSHISKNHNSASFAFKRARRVQGRVATYVKEGSRSELAKDKTFQPEFYRQIELVKAMDVRFIEASDSIAQYLLELYSCLEFDLPLDEFDTH